MILTQVEQLVDSASGIADSKNSSLIITIVISSLLAGAVYWIAKFVLNQFTTDKANAWVTIASIYTKTMEALDLLKKGSNILSDMKKEISELKDEVGDLKSEIIKLSAKNE